MPAHAALQYSQDGFDTRAGEMMGRRMAGETMLRAWIAHANPDPLTAWVHRRADVQAFQNQAREFGAMSKIEIAGVENVRPLIDAGALWLADPAIGRHAWERRWFDQKAWSIVGITHTISTAAAMDHVANLLTAPVQPWDALICTSQAVRKVVQNLLEHQASYFVARLGASACTGPELPVIPLGVNCDDFVPNAAARKKWREKLGIADDAITVLQFGRLSLHLKAHPQPLYLALKGAAERGGPCFHLVLAGQATNPQQAATMRQLAADFAPWVTTHFVDGSLPDAGEVRAAADILCLLSDNIQESFGLAPVEGMAAGLPIVGSDWDGLRDTIEHGVTGFLIETIMPSRGAGELLARRHAFGLENYHHYVASVAQVTSVNVAQAAEAFAILAADPALRLRMGEAAQQRARALFNWPHIIAAYRQLLDHLSGVRAVAAERAAPGPQRPAQPTRMDPFRLFEAYPSRTLNMSTVISLAGGTAHVADLAGTCDTAVLVPKHLADAKTLDGILDRLGKGPATLQGLIEYFPDQGPSVIAHSVGWLSKYGLVRCL